MGRRWSPGSVTPPWGRLRRAVAVAVDRRGVLGAGETVVVACSGGPDSTALLDALARLAPPRRLTLHVAHVDHGLRDGSDREAGVVAEAAATRRLPFTALSVTVRATWLVAPGPRARRPPRGAADPRRRGRRHRHRPRPHRRRPSRDGADARARRRDPEGAGRDGRARRAAGATPAARLARRGHRLLHRSRAGHRRRSRATTTPGSCAPASVTTSCPLSSRCSRPRGAACARSRTISVACSTERVEWPSHGVDAACRNGFQRISAQGVQRRPSGRLRAMRTPRRGITYGALAVVFILIVYVLIHGAAGTSAISRDSGQLAQAAMNYKTHSSDKSNTLSNDPNQRAVINGDGTDGHLVRRERQPVPDHCRLQCRSPQDLHR